RDPERRAGGADALPPRLADGHREGAGGGAREPGAPRGTPPGPAVPRARPADGRRPRVLPVRRPRPGGQGLARPVPQRAGVDRAGAGAPGLRFEARPRGGAMRERGRVAVVAGASPGLGSALCALLHERGFRVTAAGRGAAVRAVAAEVPGVAAVACDLTVP